MGSEPGMGWNWIVSLAKYCEMYIVTEGEYREKIEEWLANLENEVFAKNLHFYWNPIGDNDRDCERIRKMCWNQGDWRFYRYYRKWQKKTAEIAEDICKKENIDILHQLNMIGFREPGFLWQVSKKTGIPFVWGPIGGLKQFPLEYAHGAGMKMQLFNFIKNKINVWQIAHDKRVSLALHQASLLISSIPDSYNAIKKFHNLESVVIPETGCFPNDFENNIQDRFAGPKLNIIWVGKFDFRKRLDLALRSIAEVRSNGTNVSFDVYGMGSDKQVQTSKELAANLGIQDCINFMGNRPHEDVVSAMKSADLFLFTSVSEDTSTVVLEAISCCLPVLCFDACGMSAVVDESIGIKIPLTTPEQSINDFAQAITSLYNDREKLAWLSANCRKHAVELSWENKALQMLELYKNVVLAPQKGMLNQAGHDIVANM
jgi:glycosyltransferase involved in cell wall biosynthesis